MGARGINLAEEGHAVQLFGPGSISGGVSGQVFSLSGAAKANIFLSWGTLAAAQGAVTVSACTDLAGDNPVAIPFDLYQQAAAGAGNDVLALTGQGLTTYTPSDTPNVVDVLHIQSDYLPDGYAYVKVNVADGTNADNCSILALLTGLRNGGQSNPSATV